MSTNFSERMNARRDVKREFVEQNLDTEEINVLGVIPARRESRVDPPESENSVDNLALTEIGGRPLIEYSIKEALASNYIDRLIVSTEDEAIAERSRQAGAEVPFLRDESLSSPTARLWEVIESLLARFSEDEMPDIIAILPYVSPLRTAGQIDEAIDTSLLFSVDSVISVYENKQFLWQPGKYGLEPLFEQRLLRKDRETTYYENGAIYVTRPETVQTQNKLIGQHVGHILMKEQNSVHLDSWFDFRVCEDLIRSENMVGYVSDDLSDATRIN
jgi:N-acylneuraminate cytidylyltransferase